MRVSKLAPSQAVLPTSLAGAGIHEVDQLAEYTTGELIQRPELSSGVELYELICELHRHGLTPFSRHGGHVQGEREREMFRLRAVEGLTLDQIGERFGIKRARASCFACTSVSMECRLPREGDRRSSRGRPRSASAAGCTCTPAWW
jgi:hypothetical protein